jgi:hypothetical protein
MAATHVQPPPHRLSSRLRRHALSIHALCRTIVRPTGACLQIPFNFYDGVTGMPRAVPTVRTCLVLTATNAIIQADTPTLDALRDTRPDRWRLVKAHGTAVGLPTDDDMGNSEVCCKDTGRNVWPSSWSSLTYVALQRLPHRCHADVFALRTASALSCTAARSADRGPASRPSA